MSCHICGSIHHDKKNCVFKNILHSLDKGQRGTHSETRILREQFINNSSSKTNDTLRILRLRYGLLSEPPLPLPPPPAVSIEGNVDLEFHLSDEEVLGYARLFQILPKNNHSALKDLRAGVIKKLDSTTYKGSFATNKTRKSSIALMCDKCPDDFEHLETTGYIDVHGAVGDVTKFILMKCKQPGCDGKLVWRPFLSSKGTSIAPPPPPPPAR